MRDLPQPTLALSALPDLKRPLARLRRTPAVLPLPVPALSEPSAPEMLDVRWARHADEIEQAQRLRHQVFVEEMGARLDNLPGTPAGLDRDRFDAHCEHLLVRDVQGEVIGTYRVLTPVAAARLGTWYSETEFDLAPLRPLMGRMAELGRSCVHPDHRNGGVILALWRALADFMHRNGLDTMVGCASVSLRDGGHSAASLWQRLRTTHLADPALHVVPRLPLPVEDLDSQRDVETPPLIKGYLRCGAKLLGAPAWDPDFNTADLPVMLRLADIPPRYRRHFLGEHA